MIDYKSIVENLKPEEVANLMMRLGAEHIEFGDGYFATNTICHNEDASEASLKLYFYYNTKIFNCYTECGTMSIFKFLKHYYDTRGIIYDWYEDIYKVVLDCSSYDPNAHHQSRYIPIREKYEKGKLKELDVVSPYLLDCFTKFYPPEWLKDGISKEAMDKFHILYSISQNKIIIPHYNPNGLLIGIRGRALDEWEVENIGKYAPVKIEDTWYSHPLSLNLYGLSETKDNIKKYGICYLFESEKSVLQMESFSIPNCAAAVCGSNFNKFALKQLLKCAHPKEIIICFDNEEKPGEDKYFNKLYKICEKYKTYVNMSFVYDRKGISKLKDSPTDNGQQVFEKLIESRVRVK